MKITLVTETSLPFIAGVSSSTDSIARFLVKKGHEVSVISPKPILPAEKENEYKIIYTPSFKDPFFQGKPTSPWPLPLLTMNKRITKAKADLLHIQEAGSLGFAALLFARLRKIPVLGALHSVPEQITAFIKDFPGAFVMSKLIYISLVYFYNHCDAVMVPSQTFAASVKSMGVKKRIIPISNGVNINVCLPGEKSQEIYEKFNLPKDKTLFFYIGRIDRDKNIETIFKALTRLPNSLHFVIGGGGKDKQKLQNIAKNLKVNNKITWITFSSKEEIIKTYQTVDCFIIMAPFESQSIVALEAISCGLPVIAADAGALPELCHDGVNGFLIPPYDDQKLAEKMELLTQNMSLRKQMGKVSRQLALPHEKEKSLQKLEDLYKELCEEKN